MLILGHGIGDDPVHMPDFQDRAAFDVCRQKTIGPVVHEVCEVAFAEEACRDGGSDDKLRGDLIDDFDIVGDR